MTDHGNMFGASEFYNSATKAGIKPIIGVEAYIAPTSRFDTRRILWEIRTKKADDVSGSGSYTHLTMIAENATGLRNLFRLSSLASFEGQLGKWSRMDAEIIAEHSAGIIATTGCPSGEVQTRLRLGHYREALESAAGGGDLRRRQLLPRADGPRPFHRASGARRAARDRPTLGIPPLATNDCYYVTRDAAHNHEALLAVQTGKTLSDPNRFKFDGDGYYLKSAAEMRALWDSEIPGRVTHPADRRTGGSTPTCGRRVTGCRCSRCPTGMIERGCGTRWTPAWQRFPRGLPDGYAARAAYEIEVICDKGFRPTS